jgi:hypothetical protein
MTKIKKSSGMPLKIEQPNSTLNARPETPPIDEALIKLIDDITEFSDISAFICHALAVSLSDRERINDEIATGARICTNWLQSRANVIKEDIRHVQFQHVQSSLETHHKPEL